MKLQSHNFKAIITDMDGLLIDSESWSFNAWILACKEIGFDLPYEFAVSGAGMGREPFKKMLSGYFGPNFDVVKANDARNRIGNEILEREGMNLRPGVREFLDYVSNNKILFGLASSTFRADALRRLKYADINPDIFHILTFGDDVTKLKPDPEIYLKTAARLNVHPQEVLAFEDSLSGVKSALAAGMTVVCIPDMQSYTPPDDPKVIVKESLFDLL